MIRKLRRNFIIVAMCSTLAVLSIIVGALNIVTYQDMVEKSDAILDVLASNNAKFPETNIPSKIDKKEKNNDMHGMSSETPFETRFFSVVFDESGNILSIDTGKIAAIGSQDAANYAQAVYESGQTSGFYEKFRYKVSISDEKTTLIFVDRSRELESFQVLLMTSLLVSVLGLLAVFVLVVVFSKKVFEPVALSYEKQKQFITDASHELKTPITIINANVEILEMENTENSWTQSIKNQTKRLTNLVEQMVTLSRMDERQQLENVTEFSLTDALEETIHLFDSVAIKNHKNLQIHIDKNMMYKGDEKLIRQMVSLLIDNAMKYSSDKGDIHINASLKGKHCLITFYNTVEEIEKGNLNILFERFYRLDSSRHSKTGGSGIGLSIVKSIVDLHHGKISAKSTDGKSIQISMTL